MRILCIARHPVLSRHIAALCEDAGGDCRIAVGAENGLQAARLDPPDVVLCEVDLLVPEAICDWEREPRVARVPLLAVSLTRRQNESPALAGTPVAGYLYLPTLGRVDLGRTLAAAAGLGAGAPPPDYRWPSLAEPPAPEPTPAA